MSLALNNWAQSGFECSEAVNISDPGWQCIPFSDGERVEGEPEWLAVGADDNRLWFCDRWVVE